MAWSISPDFSVPGYRLNPYFCQSRLFGVGLTTVSTTTLDGKTVPELLGEAVHVCTWNMEVRSQNAWGTVASPSVYSQYGIAIQDECVANGGGWALKIGMGPRTNGTYLYPTGSDPESIGWHPNTIPDNQAQDSDPKPFSLNWLKNWLTYGVGRWGEDKAAQVVLDNEYGDKTLSVSTGADPGWYLGSDGWNCQDWGYVNARYYALAALTVIPTITSYGFNFVEGARTPLSAFETTFLLRWLFGTGNSGWPHGSSDNTDQPGLGTSTHGYGTSVSVDSGFAAATVSSGFRTYINNYCTNHNAFRTHVPDDHKFLAEEMWFTRKTMTSTDTTALSREALGHLVFYMMDAANAEDWNCQGHLFWGVGPVDFPSAGGGSPESWIMTSGGHVIRLPAFYAIRDICRYAVDTYPVVVGSNSLQVGTDGLLWLAQKDEGSTSGCVIIVNSSAVTQTLSFDAAAFVSIASVKKLPTALAVDTGLTSLGTTIPATLAVNEALLVEGVVFGSERALSTASVSRGGLKLAIDGWRAV